MVFEFAKVYRPVWNHCAPSTAAQWLCLTIRELHVSGSSSSCPDPGLQANLKPLNLSCVPFCVSKSVAIVMNRSPRRGAYPEIQCGPDPPGSSHHAHHNALRVRFALKLCVFCMCECGWPNFVIQYSSVRVHSNQAGNCIDKYEHYASENVWVSEWVNERESCLASCHAARLQFLKCSAGFFHLLGRIESNWAELKAWKYRIHL